jgi:hypothetical protein
MTPAFGREVRPPDGRSASLPTGVQERTAMIAHLGKIALMVVMTHGFRALSRFSNPRWAGLALGLPCSTAVALVGGGSDRGVDYAVAMSETSLIGLAGAVALPMAYARAIGRGWRLPRAIGLAVAAYLLIALSADRLFPGRGDSSVGVASVAVVAAIWMASRIPVDDARERRSREAPTGAPIRLLRTIVPIACLLSTLVMGEVFGPELAGLASTFPGVTLTVLMLTHLEAGPASAIRMARALPAGNLGMVAFLAAFRLGCPAFGLIWGTVAGYVSAVAMLAVVVTFDRLRAFARGWIASALLLIAFDCDGGPDHRSPITPSWPRAGRRFSPLIEPIAA